MTTPVTSAGPFRRRTLIALVGVGLTSLLVMLILFVFADDLAPRRSAGSDGYSESAIGHRALIEILRALDVPVVVSRHRSAERARDGLLVIAAPDPGPDDAEAAAALREMVHDARRALVILPRWDGVPDETRPTWIVDRDELPVARAQAVIDALELDAGVGRVDAAGVIPIEPFRAPALDGPQVLWGAATLDPDVETREGAILLGHEYFDADTKLWVLADPSPLDNAGLRDRANLHFAVGVIEELRRGGPVVFDQTLHGYVEEPSLWKALLRFPLVLVTAQALLCLGLLVWAGAGRWGPPRASAPPLASGKDFLIRNTASLMHVAGHDADALRRYLTTTIHAVATALHAPRELTDDALRAWLERVRATRGGGVALPELEAEVARVAAAGRRARAADVTVAAARIHRWRLEMTHGPHEHP